jgi:hypothetical protein
MYAEGSERLSLWCIGNVLNTATAREIPSVSANFGVRVSRIGCCLCSQTCAEGARNVSRMVAVTRTKFRQHLDRFMMFSYKLVQKGTMNLEVLWSGLWPNKRLVMTVSARCSFWCKCPLLRAFQCSTLLLPVMARKRPHNRSVSQLPSSLTQKFSANFRFPRIFHQTFIVYSS